MICIYPADCTDFSSNGAGTLLPQSCTVTETLNGEYELTLEDAVAWTESEERKQLIAQDGDPLDAMLTMLMK